ncbi:Flp pilus assembly complex ATPase component TadA [Candidatus Dojkabacteria bacterium]|nr:Flp pilus assembly complex ATPase component TadA [Candidatus Dojkabacteria bacterium]
MNPTRSILQQLVTQGVIPADSVNKVEVERTKTSETEEQIIRRLGLVDEKALIKAKSDIFNIPYVDLTALEIPEQSLSEINVESLRKYNAVPFSHVENVVKVAMLDPFDVQVIQALETKYPAGTKLEIYFADANGVNAVLDRRVGDHMSTEVTDALEDVQVPVADLTEQVGDEYVGNMEGMDLKSAPVARIVNSILQYGVKTGSSDIHIEPLENRLRVRFRVNGMMTERLSLPKHLASSVVSRLKILARLKIDEKRVPLDGRLQLKIGDKKIDVRVSTLPNIYGEKVVMRLLENDLEHISLDTTGLRGAAYKHLLDAMSVTNGIILVTGPTGSGKTRTLAGALIRLNDPKVNIITLEDPVEIRVPGVTQVQVKAEVGLTFAAGLRSILRQDPDIVLVGEIRDQETAQLAVQASLTGHLVLSTLHTNSSSAAIPRLLDMGIESYLLASTLRCIVAQRLPRRVCKYCAESYPAAPEVMKNIKEALASVKNFDVVNYAKKLAEAAKTREAEGVVLKMPDKDPSGMDQIYLYRGKGCDRCGGSGYKGRTGIFEVLTVTEKIGRMMMEDVMATDVEKTAIEDGMITMIQDGYLKAIEGITTIEEVLRVSKD